MNDSFTSFMWKEGFIMKKLGSRILLMTAMLMMVLSIHTFAATRQYSAKTVMFPNNYGAGWSNQFTLSTWTNISIGISLNNVSGVDVGYINNNLSFVFQNAYTGARYELTGKNNSSLQYTLTTAVPAGSYSFGAYYSGTSTLNLYFSITGTGGVKVPDKLEVQIGTDSVVPVVEENSQTSAQIKTCVSSNEAVAVVSNINNALTPPRFTIHGVQLGTCTVTVTGNDGSTDTVLVNVVQNGVKPTLLYTELNMSSGEIVYNEVFNATAKVKWSSSKKAVATVGQDGRIKAVSYGKAKITAKTTVGGVAYQMSCTVNVVRSNPEFIGKITSYNAANKKVVIKIKNTSGTSMIVQSGDAQLYSVTAQGLDSVRSLKMKNKSKVTIGNNKTKKITFTVNGNVFTGNKTNVAVRVKFKMDGRFYYALVYADQTLGKFILKQNLGTNNWLATYS